MSAIKALQATTIYFEQSMRSQLETQESEMRDQLKNQETEMREMRLNKARDSRIVEKLRPLCQELPPDALDPVTFEPFERPLIYRCGHAIDTSTAVKIAKINHLNREGSLGCNLCRMDTRLKSLHVCFPLESCLEHLKKIKNLFNNEERNERME